MPANLFDLRGKVALVTGGSKGLGKAMAQGLADAGADIVICSRHEQELHQALDEILKGKSNRGLAVGCDMTQREEVNRLAKKAVDALGRVDILVNNAGSNTPQPADEITDANWDNLLELNLSSIMVLTRALIPQMKERRWGRIVHISSILGHVSLRGRSIYSATKSGLLGLARAEAADLGPFGITVNCISPGPFLTELPLRLLNEQQQQKFTDRTMLGRWGKPEELIGPLLLLASEAGGYITGQSIIVDGGYTAW
jgi:NAD(P)-dependent dehydrogenase (short-subunit alcohol dehydrogenase family)